MATRPPLPRESTRARPVRIVLFTHHELDIECAFALTEVMDGNAANCWRGDRLAGYAAKWWTS